MYVPCSTSGVTVWLAYWCVLVANHEVVTWVAWVVQELVSNSRDASERARLMNCVRRLLLVGNLKLAASCIKLRDPSRNM